VQAELAQILSEFDELADDGREKRALDRSCGIAGENGFLDLAERVGVFESDSAEPHEIETDSVTILESASSALPVFASVCVCLPLFAGFAAAMSLEMTLDVGLRRD
jgi:hypothetical protein